MTSFFKPRGLAIYRLERKKGQLADRYRGSFKTRGRTGSRARFLFSQLPDHRRQRALTTWLAGSCEDLSA